MSTDENKNELVDQDISEEAVQVEEEIVSDHGDSNLEEGKAKAKVETSDKEEDEDEDDKDVKESEESDEDDEEEKEVEELAIPKTKAGVISAAVEMLKKARKEDAQKLYAKMAKVSEGEEEDSIASVAAASKKVKKATAPGAKARVEAVDFDEDLDALIKEEATLSESFRGKAGSIFEAVLTSKLTQEVERLEAEYVQNLEEEVSDIQSSIVEKVDSYLNYVVENWMKENEVAVANGLRTEIAEDFMTSLQKVFTEHYISVPEGKVDLVDELSTQVAELEESLNKSVDENIQLHESVQNFEKTSVIREQSSGLAETEAEKLASLVEDIEFDNRQTFEMKVKTVKESYFTSSIVESVDEVNSLIGEDTAPVAVSDTMSRYTQAITKNYK